MMQLILLFGMIIFSEKEEIRIYWNNSYELKRSDFQGIPDLSSAHDAESAVGIELHNSFNETQDTMTISIHSYFDRNSSWYKINASNGILRHEQIHFDIEELYCRKMKNEFQKCTFELINYNDKLDSIYRNLSLEKDYFQAKYDSLTMHGINTVIQNQWDSLIETELKSLEKFDSISLHVELNY